MKLHKRKQPKFGTTLIAKKGEYNSQKKTHKRESQDTKNVLTFLMKYRF